MFRKVLLFSLAFLAVYSLSFASVAIEKEGVKQGVATTINIVGMGVDTNGSTFDVGVKTEKGTTSDTLTASENGLIVVNDPTAGVTCTYTLPEAVVDMQFTFINGDEQVFNVDPYSTDLIKYLGMSAGDKLTAPAATGDSVTLVCHEDNVWAIKSMVGTFTDGN